MAQSKKKMYLLVYLPINLLIYQLAVTNFYPLITNWYQLIFQLTTKTHQLMNLPMNLPIMPLLHIVTQGPRLMKATPFYDFAFSLWLLRLLKQGKGVHIECSKCHAHSDIHLFCLNFTGQNPWIQCKLNCSLARSLFFLDVQEEENEMEVGRCIAQNFPKYQKLIDGSNHESNTYLKKNQQ